MARNQTDPRDWPIDEDEQLQTRVAWSYYVGNQTQQQIADRMGTSRARINRLLSAGRESGVVQIGINGRLAECVELEQKLAARYTLHDAVVVPTPDDPRQIRQAVGIGAAGYLQDAVVDGQTIAIGWGRTLAVMLRAITACQYRSSSVVSLQGGLSYCARINTFEIVFDFANRFACDCYYFAAPIYASSEAARNMMLEQEAIRETYEKARSADIDVITAGDMTESLIVEYGLRGDHDAQALVAAGAVGDLIGHFVDQHGARVDHELNRRTVAVSLDDLRAIDQVMLIAGGEHKVPVTQAALRGGYVNTLVTDQATAKALFELL